MMDMYCPECKTLLNDDEKASGRCFNCGARFSAILPETKNDASVPVSTGKNTIAGILKAIGFLVMIFGTIASIGIGGQGYEFSFASFLLLEIGTIVFGMVFLGFSEMLQLLQDIKNKMK